MFSSALFDVKSQNKKASKQVKSLCLSAGKGESDALSCYHEKIENSKAGRLSASQGHIYKSALSYIQHVHKTNKNKAGSCYKILLE